ncbi:hypothetical protein Taro_030816 [Colocasia esculenta]|uniref:Uncharacterized protein n=1 Tax=Colocasia esculenta TaxID=4460 RepID=A0A843VZ07_COLES|nr:hypothetical protein [Colocasia esculenta]
MEELQPWREAPAGKYCSPWMARWLLAADWGVGGCRDDCASRRSTSAGSGGGQWRRRSRRHWWSMQVEETESAALVVDAGRGDCSLPTEEWGDAGMAVRASPTKPRAKKGKR